jgi:hypothetical protein
MSTSTERWQAHINKLEKEELHTVHWAEEGCTLTQSDISKFYAVMQFRYPHRQLSQMTRGELILACGFFMEYEQEP